MWPHGGAAVTDPKRLRDGAPLLRPFFLAPKLYGLLFEAAHVGDTHAPRSLTHPFLA